MKFLTPTVHGALDYIAAITLIIAPFVLGLQGLALWMSVAAGAGLIVYSLITDYAYSIAKAIPFPMHIILDTTAAITFIAAPFIFSFSDVAQIYYWVMGVGVLMVVLVTKKQSTD